MKEYLATLRQTQEFHNLIEMIREKAPVVPRHTVNPDNTELWKAQSHEREGFDLCLAQLTGVVKNE